MCRHYLHKLRPLILLVAFSVTGGGRGVLGGNKGDEADLIIRTILTNYEPQAHPNSDRDDGAVVVDIDLSPLSISIVRLYLDVTRPLSMSILLFRMRRNRS